MDPAAPDAGRRELPNRSRASRGRHVFGTSVEGRPLTVAFAGDPAADLRILVVAGQHGDEADARAATAELIERSSSASFRAKARLALVADANPDGSAAGTRRNASDVDLNRDHLLLEAPETRAIHAFIHDWQPHLVIDLHTYRPWRKELLAYDFVFAQDVMIDFPTNPAVRTAIDSALHGELLDHLSGKLSEIGARCDRYTLIRSGVVRHSTVDILDARNTLALRFEIPVVLVEGRRASPQDSPNFAPTRAALLRSLEALIGWSVVHGTRLRKPASRAARAIPVRCRYSPSQRSRYMELQSARTRGIARTRVPGTYLSRVEPTGNVTMPAAYAVPRTLTGVLDVLHRHRFATAPAGEFRSRPSQIYQIELMMPGGEQDPVPVPRYRTELSSVDLDEFCVFSTARRGGRLLPLLLEPLSQFGPPRLGDLVRALQRGARYPVVRLV